MTGIIAQAVAALIAIESGGNSAAIGDNGRAVGCLQMWPIAVREANRLAGTNRWTLADRLERGKSVAMAEIILAWHYRRGVRDVAELAARWRNPKGNAPEWYRNRIKKAIKGARKT